MPLNSLFTYNEAYYLSQNPDVAQAVRAQIFLSGFDHWRAFGYAEGRTASRFFDWEVYRDNNPDLAEAGITTKNQLTSHFNQYGATEGRLFLNDSLFDYQYYADHNPDLAAAGITSREQLVHHFCTYGVYEGRAASSLVNGASYVDQNPDLKALLEAGGNIHGYTIANKDKAGIFHYYNWGINEGRSLGAPRVDDPLPTVNSSTPIWATDANADGVYNAGDVIHIKLSEAVSTASAFDLHLGSGRSLAGTTFSPVGASSGYASEFQILLNAGASVSANDVLILGRQSVVDQQGQKPAGDLLFVLPKLPQPAPAMPAFSLSIDVFGDSNVNSSETSPMTGIHAAVTSSSLASLVVSGLRQASAHQETAVWNPSTELYEFDATQFDDGVLSVLARDIYGQSQSFSLTKDATAPLLSGSSPLDNATGVAVGSDIQLTFNENVQLGTFGLISLYKSDNTLIESFDVSTNLAGKVSVANGVVTINPTADLDAGTGYYILIDAAAIKDTVGNNYAGLSGVGDLNFTTLQPGILGTSGADSLTGTVAADTIYGFAGNDTITGGAGSDALYGGADADVFVVNAVSGVSSESNMSNMDRINDFESGVDHLQINMTEVQSFDGSGVYPVSYGSYVALGGAGSDFYVGVSPTGQNPMAGIAGATNVVVWFSSMSQASAAYNSLQYNITGTASADNIVAGANDDTVTGGGGNDVIDLGAGMNTVVVGAILTAGTDVVTGIGSDDKISFSTVVAYADLTSNGDMRTLFDPMSPTPRSLIEAATLLVGSSDGWALGFIYDNKNYVVIDGHANHYAFDATTDAIVELVGTTLSALGSGNFIS